MNIIIYLFTFFIGITFGSFFTLAVYRIPLREDITHKRSFCPNCNHKLSFFDMIPILSYIFLGGKCRYCHEKIRIRYLLLEVFSGLVFLSFAISVKFNISLLSAESIGFFAFGLLFIAGLFIIAGIDKEKIEINNGVLLYLIIVETLYIIYLYILKNISVYRYVIYLFTIVVFVVVNNLFYIKKLKNNYTIQIVILMISMLIFTGEYVALSTVIFTIFLIVCSLIHIKLKNNVNKAVVKDASEIKEYKIPIAYYMCIGNIISFIIFNFIQNYRG